MSKVEGYLERVMAVAEGRIVEPASAYSLSSDFEGVTICRSEAAEAPKIPRARGQENYIFCGLESRVSSAIITFAGSRNVVFFGPYCIPGSSAIHITGNDCLYFFGAFSTAVSVTTKLAGPNGLVLFGDDCMLSARVVTSNEDGHGIYDLRSGSRINTNRNVIVDDHVWVGRDVRINKGAYVGKDVILGQGSVASGTLRPQSIYAGIPARQIREGVTWSRWDLPSLQDIEKSQRQKQHLEKVAALRDRIMLSNR